ncbi:MAG TPA: hypothetical protein VIF34_16600 [Methylocystis sp.]|jgi:hypothetical protein
MRRLLKQDGSYDRAAIVARANVQLRDARRLGLDWDRAHCLAYVWRQARAQRAAFLGVELPAPRKRRPTHPENCQSSLPPRVGYDRPSSPSRGGRRPDFQKRP